MTMYPQRQFPQNQPGFPGRGLALGRRGLAPGQMRQTMQGGNGFSTVGGGVPNVRGIGLMQQYLGKNPTGLGGRPMGPSSGAMTDPRQAMMGQLPQLGGRPMAPPGGQMPQMMGPAGLPNFAAIAGAGGDPRQQLQDLLLGMGQGAQGRGRAYGRRRAPGQNKAKRGRRRGQQR